MFPGFHGIDLVVILVVALLIFGPKRLPEMGSAVGKTFKEFKKSVSEIADSTSTSKEISPVEKNNS
jgi:sec-independent protein translocase protein TatA